MLDIVALGELLVDLVHKGDNEAGYPILHANPGGAPANFLCAAAACGAQTAMIGKVGSDAFGRMLTETLTERGVNVQGVTATPEAFTTLAFVTVDKNGEREFSFARKPGADMTLSVEDLRYSLLRNTRAFHFGTISMTAEPSRTATRKAVEIARESGAMITFDPNYRASLWRDEGEAAEQVLWGVKNADIVKISEEEIRLLLNETPEEGARRLVEKFHVKLALVTLGEKGVFFASKNASGLVFAFRDLNPVDATGAGDIFAGSAITRILQSGKAPEELTCEELTEICRFANAAAGISVTRSGGIPSIPKSAEVEAYLTKQQG